MKQQTNQMMPEGSLSEQFAIQHMTYNCQGMPEADPWRLERPDYGFKSQSL